MPGRCALHSEVFPAPGRRMRRIKHIAQFHELKRWAPACASPFGEIAIEIRRTRLNPEYAQDQFRVARVSESRILHQADPPTSDLSADSPSSSREWLQISFFAHKSSFRYFRDEKSPLKAGSVLDICLPALSNTQPTSRACKDDDVLCSTMLHTFMSIMASAARARSSG